jgi:hypothetical protein
MLKTSAVALMALAMSVGLAHASVTPGCTPWQTAAKTCVCGTGRAIDICHPRHWCHPNFGCTS